MIGPRQLYQLSQDVDFCNTLAELLEIECDAGEGGSFLAQSIERMIDEGTLNIFKKCTGEGKQAYWQSLSGATLNKESK